MIISKDIHFTVVGWYRLLSATKEAISSLSDALHSFSDTNEILMGDLNWDWLSSASNCIKEL